MYNHKLLITGLSVQATSISVALSSDVTLTCKPSTLYTYQYNSFSWHRINGVIPMQSNGQNTNTLTIPSIKKDDQGMYYCMAIRHKVHCAVSDNVMVSVKGKVIFCICYYKIKFIKRLGFLEKYGSQSRKTGMIMQ